MKILTVDENYNFNPLEVPRLEITVDHLTDHHNPHQVTSTQVGLGNVDNTADADKPVSAAVQAALDSKTSRQELLTISNEKMRVELPAASGGTLSAGLPILVDPVTNQLSLGDSNLLHLQSITVAQAQAYQTDAAIGTFQPGWFYLLTDGQNLGKILVQAVGIQSLAESDAYQILVTPQQEGDFTETFNAIHYDLARDTISTRSIGDSISSISHDGNVLTLTTDKGSFSVDLLQNNPLGQNNFVHLTGNETVAGNKTFSAPLTVLDIFRAKSLIIGSNNTVVNLNSGITAGENNQVVGNYGFIGGGTNNYTSGEYYACIVGGYANRIDGDHSFLGGGANNTVSGAKSVIVGGQGNYANNSNTFIGGGTGGQVLEPYCAVVGGRNNVAYATAAFVGCGTENQVYKTAGAIVGGSNNTITENGHYGFIGGGAGNVLLGYGGVIVGGFSNHNSSGQFTFVGGGNGNVTGADYSAVLAGYNNQVFGSFSAIIGSRDSTISAGCSNVTLLNCNGYTTAQNLASVTYIGTNTEVFGDVKAVHYVGDGSQLTNLPRQGNLIGQFPEFTATASGTQIIALPTAALAAFAVVILAEDNSVRTLYPGNYLVSGTTLIITASAGIAAGDKIMGNYYS